MTDFRIDAGIGLNDRSAAIPEVSTAMSRDTTLKRILDCGIVAVVRAESGALLARS